MFEEAPRSPYNRIRVEIEKSLRGRAMHFHQLEDEVGLMVVEEVSGGKRNKMKNALLYRIGPAITPGLGGPNRPKRKLTAKSNINVSAKPPSVKRIYQR